MRFPERLWNELTGAQLAQLGASDAAAEFLRSMPTFKRLTVELLGRMGGEPGPSGAVNARKRQNESHPHGGKKTKMGGSEASKPPKAPDASKLKGAKNPKVHNVTVLTVGDIYKKMFFVDAMPNLKVVSVEDIAAMRKFMAEDLQDKADILFVISEWALTLDGVKELRDLGVPNSLYCAVITATPDADIVEHRKIPTEGEDFKSFGRRLLKEAQEAGWYPLSRQIL